MSLKMANSSIIPIEIDCNILHYIKDISEIISYMRTSTKFLDAAKYCVTELQSSTLVQVPIENFANFVGLREIKKIILMGSPNIIETIPKLYKMTFFIGNLIDLSYLGYTVTLILQNLHSKNKVLDIRIIAYYNGSPIGFVFQDNRFMILGLKDYKSFVIDIQKYDPSWILIPTISIMNDPIGINYANIYKCYPAYFIMKRFLKDFLNTSNFGLLYPDKPPSEDNIPLSEYAKMIANIGIDQNSDEENITLKFLEIYLIYNQIDNFQKVIDYFQPDVTEYKRILNEYAIDYTDIPDLNILWIIVYRSTFIDANKNNIRRYT